MPSSRGRRARVHVTSTSRIKYEGADTAVLKLAKNAESRSRISTTRASRERGAIRAASSVPSRPGESPTSALRHVPPMGSQPSRTAR